MNIEDPESRLLLVMFPLKLTVLSRVIPGVY